MSKISVISPIYNGEKYISNLIKSLKNQTFKDFEFILVNDGSTDNTLDIAEKELSNSKINYKIINQKNSGQSRARNIGIQCAKGEWIVTIDSDDTIQSGYLENLYKATLLDNSEVVFCDLNRVNEKTIFQETTEEFICETLGGKDFFQQFFMHEVEIGPISILINKKYLDNIKLLYNENSKYSEEYIFINYLLYNAKSVTHLKQKLYNYCLRKGSVSTSGNIEKIINGFNEILKSNDFYKSENNEYAKKYLQYAMPRWVIATSRFSAKNLNYKKYKELLYKLSYKEYVKELKTYPSFKIKLASTLLLLSPYLFYIISRHWGNK